MPGRIIVAPGLPADDRGFLAEFAGGGEGEAALFATRSLLERWRDEALAASPGRALGGRRFFLFAGLVRALLGPGEPVPDPEAVRRRAASLALAELAARGRLQALAPLAGSGYLAADALNALGELKRSLVPPEGAALLSPALADLVAAWRIWRNKAVDEEDLLLRACLLLEGRDAPRLEWHSLLVHGFTDFSPLQARLLQGLAGRGVAVTILLPDAAPFAPLAQLRRRLLDQFPGWEVQTADGSAGGPGPLPDGGAIELSAEGEGALASLIARTIRARLAADPGLTPDDIALVRRAAGAGSPFIAALRRHGLRVAEETGPPLRRLNSVGTILAALTAVARDWPRETILRLARGVFTGRDADLAESLGRISAELRVVRTRAAWEVLLNPAADAGDGLEIGAARRALAVLAEGLSRIPERGTPGDYLRALRALVERWDMPANWWPRDGDDSALAAYAANMAGLEAIFAHLEAIGAAEDRFGGQRTWEAVELLAELERMAGEACLPAPKAGGGIRCLNPSEIRGLRFRLVFLVGLAEGEFPKAMAENWLLPEEARRRLAADGYRLDLRPTLAAREWQLLANVVGAAETLYLCWSRTDARGEGEVASPFLTHLRELFAPLPRVDLPAGEVLPGCPGEAWDDQSRLGRLVADLLWTGRAGEEDGAAAALAAYEQSRQEVAAVIERARSDRDGPADDLTAEEFRRHLKDRFGPERVVSTSALEDYALCPFLFFARRLLGLAATRRPDEDLDALDLGLAYHAALEKLFRRLGPARLDRREWPRYEEAAAAAAAEAFAPLAGQARTPAAARLIAQGRESCRRSLLGFLRAETRRAERGSPWRIGHAELGFGLGKRPDLDPASTAEPLVLGEGPGRIRLAGKIDRVDLTPGRYFAVYDYKRGRAPAAADVRSGRTLQIPIYLLAVAALIHPELEPAGGGYYSLRDLTRAAGLWRSELADLTGISTRTAGSLDEEEWREALGELTAKILAAVEGIRAGRFPPTEEPCPPYCEYAEVCRKEGG